LTNFKSHAIIIINTNKLSTEMHATSLCETVVRHKRQQGHGESVLELSSSACQQVGDVWVAYADGADAIDVVSVVMYGDGDVAAVDELGGDEGAFDMA
jgi:hypothetical protein